MRHVYSNRMKGSYTNIGHNNGRCQWYIFWFKNIKLSVGMLITLCVGTFQLKTLDNYSMAVARGVQGGALAPTPPSAPGSWKI